MTVLLVAMFGIFGLGIIVLVHELGHFAAAKACGIEVEVLSLGWGKRLVGVQRGATLYQVAWFPIGGYCKMKGEMLRSDMNEERLAALRAEPGSFLAAAPWRRIVVAACGPGANFVFAVIALTLISWIGFPIHSTEARIILASQYDSAVTYPADRAGLRTGDLIVGIDGRPVESFAGLSEVIRRAPEQSLKLALDRDGRRLSLTVVPERDPATRLGRIGVQAWIEPLIALVTPGSAAERAGLRPGDLITAVGDTPVAHERAFAAAVQAAGAAAPIPVTIRRDRQERKAELVLDSSKGLDTGIGFATRVYRSQRLGLGQAAVTGLQRTGESIGLLVQGLRQLFQMHDRKLDEVVAGPIRITHMLGEAAVFGFRLGFGEGVVSFLQLVILLSIVIATMNLLPLPALDGGLIVISTAEALSRRRLGPRLLWRFQIAGAIVVFGLIFLAVASDILFYVG